MSTLRKALTAASLLLIVASALQAASVLATVDSAAPFLIKGKRVPVNGVGHWPAFSGDRIGTAESSALVSLRDGSFLLLDRNSEILLSEKNGKVGLKILKGQVAYKLTDLSSVAFENVAKTARAGTLALENGVVTASSDVAFFARFQPRRADTAPSPGTYPIQINWDNPPANVTTGSGPLPVSSYRP